jgi:hypothetical protein
MFSLGGKTLDFVDDLGFKALAASPYFAKVAHLPIGDPTVIPVLEDSQFGVVFLTKKGEAIRKYPVNDLPNTVLANVYFELTHEKLPPEAKVAAATKIREASTLFGMKALPAVEKYAVDATLEGNYVRLDKIAESTAGSEDVLGHLQQEYVAHREQYSREEKKKLAAAMAPAAEKFGFEVHGDLRPFALKDPVVDQEALFMQCAQRKRLVPDHPEAVGLLDELIEKRATFEPKEIVQLLETFDRQFDLTSRWDRDLEPYGVLMEKVAMSACPVGHPDSLPTKDEVKAFVSSSGDLLEKMFGKDFAAKAKKDPDAIWGLPNASRRFVKAHIEQARDNATSEAV